MITGLPLQELRHTRAVQEIPEEGRQEGREEGLEAGRQQEAPLPWPFASSAAASGASMRANGNWIRWGNGGGRG
jgi:hypothetical protein